MADGDPVCRYANHAPRSPMTQPYSDALRTFALLTALEATCQAGSQMSKVCVPGGQVPHRTLVRVYDLRIFTIIDGFARVEPPHGRAQPELNPPRSSYFVSAPLNTSSKAPQRTSSIGTPPLAEYRQNSAPE